MVCVGGMLWSYLLMQGRMVDRVTHPLYLAQILLAAGLWGTATKHSRARHQHAQHRTYSQCHDRCSLRCYPVALYSPGSGHVAGCGAGADTQGNGKPDKRGRVCILQKHASTLFLEDVYSTVAYSEKIMLDRDKPFNYDLLGGWLVKSPLTKQKLSAFGYASMGEAARSSEKVCLLADEGHGYVLADRISGGNGENPECCCGSALQEKGLRFISSFRKSA